ncbi:MAG: aromatic ring-hydroxylating dioxygenase subunit alpha [Candidatus Binatia bacterium]
MNDRAPLPARAERESALQRTRHALPAILSELGEIAASGNAEQKTLPPDVYDCADLFELECERIFRPGWLLMGRADQVASPGDFMSVDVIGEPLVLTRDMRGELHVFSRICRHRWMPICQGSGNATALECPYHAWTYELDGRLRGAPEMTDSVSFRRNERGLIPIRHEVWEGFVFVNLDGRAEPLAPRLEPLLEELKEFRLSECVTVASRDYGEQPWDWKVAQDNGDCYHHIGLHRKTAQWLWPIQKIWYRPDNGHYALNGCGTAPDALVTAEDGRPVMPGLFQPLPGLTAHQRENLYLVFIYPNYWIGPGPDQTLVTRMFPVGPGRVRFYTDILFHRSNLDHPELQAKIDEAKRFWFEINDEDFYAHTAVQQAARSRFADRGPLSSKEDYVRAFAKWYAQQISAAR